MRLTTLLPRALSTTESMSKAQARRLKLDPKLDFKFFVMKAKVCQVYRESLQIAREFKDPEMRLQMTDMVRDEFRPLRRDRQDTQWKLDVERIDYQLALIRKQINMIKELRDG